MGVAEPNTEWLLYSFQSLQPQPTLK